MTKSKLLTKKINYEIQNHIMMTKVEIVKKPNYDIKSQIYEIKNSYDKKV